MKKKLIKVALVGKTNAGKSTLINSMVGENISIINKKINTTQNLILGIVNIDKTQIIFYDTPGSNFLKTNILNQKKFKTNIWIALEDVDIIFYIIDTSKYNYKNIYSELNKIKEVEKPIIIIFNKIDLIKNQIILSYIKSLNKLNLVHSFFNISAKFNRNIDKLFIFLKSKAKINKWIFNNDEVTNKDDIFMSSECTRNAIFKYLHQEIPYNIVVRNTLFKVLKNNDIKIKQSIELKNMRYKPIILGKNGDTIKKIRLYSQSKISSFIKSKVHLYLQINKLND